MTDTKRLIGSVEYDEAGYEFMARIAGERTLDGKLPGTLANEAALIHSVYTEFPGVTMKGGDGG